MWLKYTAVSSALKVPFRGAIRESARRFPFRRLVVVAVSEGSADLMDVRHRVRKPDGHRAGFRALRRVRWRALFGEKGGPEAERSTALYVRWRILPRNGGGATAEGEDAMRRQAAP